MAYNVMKYGAVGDGVVDDTEAIQRTLDAAKPGGKVKIPEGHYRVTDTLRVRKSIRIRGDWAEPKGVPGTAGSYIVSDNPRVDILSVAPSWGSVSLSNVSFFGGLNCINVDGNCGLLSVFRDIACNGAANACISINATFIGSGLENIKLANSEYGILCEDAVNMNASRIFGMRISETRTAAMRLNSNTASTVIYIRNSTIEGNQGPAIDALGGMRLWIDGTHFEKNCIAHGQADILMGASNNALCYVTLSGGIFSAAGAAQGLTRIAFQGVRSQLSLIDCGIMAGNIIDGNGHGTGSRIFGSPQRTRPTVVGLEAAQVQWWPETV